MRFATPLLLLLAGCAVHALEPAEPLPPAELPVRFEVEPYPGEAAFSIQGGEGEITVRDRAITGVCHRHENHGAFRRDGEVTLWVAHTGWRRPGLACPDIGRMVPYRATIGGLPPGDYTVRVQYIGQISTDTYPRPDPQTTVTVR